MDINLLPYGKDISQFVKFVLLLYSGVTKNDSDDLKRKNQEIVRLIQHSKKVKPDKLHVYDRLLDVLSSMSEIFSKSETLKDFSNEKFSVEEFLRNYAEEIFSDNKRKYNMRNLYDDKMIVSSRNNPEKKVLKYNPYKHEGRYEYFDKNGRKVIISPLGELTFRKDNYIDDRIVKYRIQKELETGELFENIVYSDISIFDMDDEEYKNAVLEELLSENNIALSDCDGYIGFIEKTLYHGVEKNKKVIDSEGYIYKVSDKYMLKYNKDALSAVIDYSLGKGINSERRDEKSDINSNSKKYNDKRDDNQLSR